MNRTFQADAQCPYNIAYVYRMHLLGHNLSVINSKIDYFISQIATSHQFLYRRQLPQHIYYKRVMESVLTKFFLCNIGCCCCHEQPEYNPHNTAARLHVLLCYPVTLLLSTPDDGQPLSSGHAQHLQVHKAGKG